MILNMMVSTGGTDVAVTTKSVTFYGAPLETLTLYGDTVSTVTLNSNGIGTSTVLTGNYIIIGSLSKKILPSGKVAIITSSTSIVKAYPDGAIYWLGNGEKSGDSLWSTCGGWSIAHGAYPSGYERTGTIWIDTMEGAYGVDNDENGVNEGWYSWAKNTGSSRHYGVTSYITNAINYSGYNRINVFCDSYDAAYGISVFGTCASKPNSAESGNATGVAWTPQTSVRYATNFTNEEKELSLSGNSGYFCASAFGANNDSDGSWSSANNTVYAVWLD